MYKICISICIKSVSPAVEVLTTGLTRKSVYLLVTLLKKFYKRRKKVEGHPVARETEKLVLGVDAPNCTSG